MDDIAPSVRRREVLGGAGAMGTATIAGCSDRLWSRAESPPPEQVSLTVKTLPAEADSFAVKLSSRLTENFRKAGIDATHEPIREAELYREVLLERDYDLFVVRHTGLDEYDAIRSLLHSRFVGEQGWQNPFQYSDVTTDELLERQLAYDGSTRRETLFRLYEYLIETTPFSVIAYPYHLGLARSDLEITEPPRSAIDYLEILSQLPSSGDSEVGLRVGLFGQDLTNRLNPIVVDLTDVDVILDLLYDPLVRRRTADDVHWLAESIDWNEGDGGTRATITLRDGLTWHDGEPLDTDDVAFTIAFLTDTSLGEVEAGVPAPRYRGRQTLIENTTVLDSRTVQYRFGDVSKEVAKRAMTIPILPKHIWEPKRELVGDHQTEALVWDNEEPIGSGLFSVDEGSTETEMTLKPFDDHTLLTAETESLPSSLEGLSPLGAIQFRISPNLGSVVETLLDGGVDIVGQRLSAEDLNAVTDEDGISLLATPTDSFYMIGFNAQHPELTNPHFRTVLSRLIDRTHIVQSLFANFAEPATRVSSRFGVQPGKWDGPDSGTPPEFPGSDGEMDETAVREVFQEIGYRYEDGELLR